MTAGGVHAVVVNWNRADETLACLADLLAAMPGGTTGAGTVHVVDNGSADDSAARIAARFPAVRLHCHATNRGFAGGANTGIRAALAAGASHVLLLNNDARLATGAIDALLAAAVRHPAGGLFGGKIFRDRARGILWCCGVRFRFGPNIAVLRGFDEADAGRYDNEEQVDSLTGCFLLVTRAVFDRIGLLDEAYFAYVEDADFAARAADAGFACWYVPSAVAEHPGGTTTGGGYSIGRKYLTAHGAARFLKRHGTPLRWLAFLICDLLLWPLLWLSAAARGRGGAAVAKLLGSFHGLVGRPPDLRMLERR